jgi:hypothetical protein
MVAVTTLADAARPERGVDVDESPSDRSFSSSWPEHWPLTVLVLGYPLWWVVGLSAVMPILLAVPMLLQLLRRHPIRVPSGFAAWFIFLVWMTAGVTMLFVDAPGAVPGGGGGRLLVFVYRFLWYLTITIVVLWVINLGERALPTRRVVRLMGWMFVVTVLGGLLGVVAPTFEFTSLVEALLPGGLRSNDFVKSLVHPAAASVQSILGVAAPRPIAPFSFANSWGANLAMFLPFFVVGWLGRDAGWRRAVAPFVLLLAAVPIVMSLNRGLWACLALGAVFYLVRLVLTGKMVALIGAGLCVVVLGGLFIVSPLGELGVSRLENPHSNDRRGQLLTQTVVSTALGSPVLGFGSTRDVQGSFASIAGGGTPDCPRCEVPPLGTQGHIWLVIFSQGLVGAAAFLTFYGAQLARHWRSRTTIEAIGVVMLLFFVVQLLVYDTLGLPTYTLMIAIGLMERERWQRSGTRGGGLRTLESMLALLRRSAVLIVVFALLGGLVGAAIARSRPTTFVATTSVLLAPAPVYLDATGGGGSAPRSISIDTEASMVYSERAVGLVLDRLGSTDAQAVRDSIQVTAPPSSRVLDIAVRDEDPEQARLVADELAAAYLQVRGEYLEQRREQQRLQLERELDTVAGSGIVVEMEGDEAAGDADYEVLAEDLLREELDEVVLLSTDAGEVLRPATSKRVGAQSEVPIVSGLLLGMLTALIVVSLREARRRDVARRRPTISPSRR